MGIAHVGIDGRWLRVNDRLCALLGYSRDELLRSAFQDITHPDDLAENLNCVRQILAGKISTYSTEKRYFRKDRSLVWANLTVSLVRSATGQPTYFISVVEDITARKRAEEAFRASEARLEAGIELAGLGYYELDYGNSSRFVDDRFREICGLTAGQQTAGDALKFWSEHLHPDDRDRVLRKREELHSGRMARLSEGYPLPAPGPRTEVDSSCGPHRGA